MGSYATLGHDKLFGRNTLDCRKTSKKNARCHSQDYCEKAYFDQQTRSAVSVCWFKYATTFTVNKPDLRLFLFEANICNSLPSLYSGFIQKKTWGGVYWVKISMWCKARAIPSVNQTWQRDCPSIIIAGLIPLAKCDTMLITVVP